MNNKSKLTNNSVRRLKFHSSLSKWQIKSTVCCVTSGNLFCIYNCVAGNLVGVAESVRRQWPYVYVYMHTQLGNAYGTPHATKALTSTHHMKLVNSVLSFIKLNFMRFQRENSN